MPVAIISSGLYNVTHRKRLTYLYQAGHKSHLSIHYRSSITHTHTYIHTYMAASQHIQSYDIHTRSVCVCGHTRQTQYLKQLKRDKIIKYACPSRHHDLSFKMALEGVCVCVCVWWTWPTFALCACERERWSNASCLRPDPCVCGELDPHLHHSIVIWTCCLMWTRPSCSYPMVIWTCCIMPWSYELDPHFSLL